MATATHVEVTTGKVGCTCTDGFHEELYCTYKIRVEPSTDKKQYILTVWCKLANNWNMSWNGDSTLVVTCNGVTKRIDTEFAMYGTGITQNWQGGLKFSFDSSKVDELVLNLDVDLTRTAGTLGGQGPSHVNGGGNFQHFYLNNYSIDVTPIPLITPPVLGNITNTNPYTNPSDNQVKTGVSKSTSSISLAWKSTGDDAPTEMWYRIKKGSGSYGSWIELSNLYKCTISSLDSGTSYTIQVQGSNEAGDSNVLTITVRTRNAAPVCTLTLSSTNLEQLTFKWSSNKELASAFYSIDGGSFVNCGSGTSGTFIAKWFNPNTSHTISFYGVSTAALDSLTSSTKSASGTTLDRSKFNSILMNPFGVPIPFIFGCPSTYSLKLKIIVEGAGNRKVEFTHDNISRDANTVNYTWHPTQEELDSIYKCYTNSNKVGIKFILTTHGAWKDWDSNSDDYDLVLTGIAKTAHIGINGIQKRGQCFIGVDEVPKRAVVWIGINGVPKRGI